MKAIAKKRMILTAIAALSLAAVSIQGTLAYLSDETPIAVNSLGFGHVEITLNETWNQPGVATPGGAKLQKIPTVTNESGSVDAYVRLTVTGGENYTITYEVEGQDDLPYNTAYWIKDTAAPGVYYYKTKVAPGDTTEPLFNFIQLKPGYEGSGHDLDIVIYAEAIQADFVEDSDLTAKDAFRIFDSNVPPGSGA
ncbi:MAG: hypothetical protein LBU32_07385 [Clostridiales bacterium]|nr:hypothetical protein [Clostridiales bacterium]